jgi:hypothetical protein
LKEIIAKHGEIHMFEFLNTSLEKRAQQLAGVVNEVAAQVIAANFFNFATGGVEDRRYAMGSFMLASLMCEQEITTQVASRHLDAKWDYLDVRGVFEKEEVQRCECRRRQISNATIPDLKREFPFANRHGLMWNPLLILLAKSRARRRILRFLDWYNGRNKKRRTVEEWSGATTRRGAEVF